MRSLLLGLLITTSLSPPAIAAGCFVGSEAPITLDHWSVEMVNDVTHRLHLTLTSYLDAPVQTIDVEAGFHDTQGKFLGGYFLYSNLSIFPGERVEVTKDIDSLIVPQLATLKAEDVEPYFCTVLVVYKDASIKRF